MDDQAGAMPAGGLLRPKVVVGLNGCTYDRNGGTDNDPKYWYRDGYDTDNIPNAAVTDADSYRYSFIAYYPCDGSFTIDRPSGPTAAGAPVLTFSMPQTGGSVSDPLDHRQTPDAMLAVLYDRRKADGNLRFNFSHVLTGLGVEVNNFSEHDLQIHSVTLSGDFYKEVRIDLTGDVSTFSFPETYYAGTYTFFDGTPAGSYLELPAPKPESGETVTSSGLIGNEHLLLISGAENPGFFGEGVEIRLDYTFAASGNSTKPNARAPSLRVRARDTRRSSISWAMPSCCNSSSTIRSSGRTEKPATTTRRTTT